MVSKILVISTVAIVAAVGFYGAYVAERRHVESDDSLKAEFNTWCLANNKQYGKGESETRFNIWKENYAKVVAHNAKNASYTLGMNLFADLSSHEFSSIYLGAKKPTGGANCPAPNLLAVKYPETLDWRNEGRVNPVKNQGQCGSCWAFATIASLEGLHAAHGSLLSFAEQQLVDCSSSYGNAGCNGGWVQDGLQYAIANGITLEANYPYTAADGNCNTNVKNEFQPTGCVNVVNTNEGITQALQAGPTPVYVEADQDAFQLYSGGVLDDPNCFAEGQIDHAVTAVGYTTDAWIIRNSWGPSWGEAGYIRLATETTNNPQGVCGILSIGAAIPTL